MTYAEKMENSKPIDSKKLKFKEAKVITPKKRRINIVITIFLSLFTVYNYFLKKKTYLFFELLKIPSNVVLYFVYPIISLVLITNIVLTFTSKSLHSKNHPYRYKAVLYLNKFNKLLIAGLNLVNSLVIVEYDLSINGYGLLGETPLKELYNFVISDFSVLKDFALFAVAVFTFVPYFFVCYALYFVIPVFILISPFLFLRWLFSANDIFYNYYTDSDEEGYVIREKRRITKKYYKFQVIMKKILYTVCIVAIVIGVAFIVRCFTLQS